MKTHRMITNPVTGFKDCINITGKLSRNHTRKIKLCEAQNWHCAYCGISICEHLATIDHVIPVKEKGSRGSIDNMVAACYFCNALKREQNAMNFYEGINLIGVLSYMRHYRPKLYNRKKRKLIELGYK